MDTSSTKYVYSMYKIPYNTSDWPHKLVLTLIRSEFTNSLFSEINQIADASWKRSNLILAENI